MPLNRNNELIFGLVAPLGVELEQATDAIDVFCPPVLTKLFVFHFRNFFIKIPTYSMEMFQSSATSIFAIIKQRAMISVKK